MSPTYGACAYCGTFGPLAAGQYADAPPDACVACAIVIVAERSPALAVLPIGDVLIVSLVTSVELAALN